MWQPREENGDGQDTEEDFPDIDMGVSEPEANPFDHLDFCMVSFGIGGGSSAVEEI